jgi:DNA topoisomerase VI subunit B
MSVVLKRVHFSTSRATEYFRVSELQAQTGQPASEFGHVILKELVDNALDAAETAGVAPEVTIEWLEIGARIKLIVSDNGPGIPDHVVERILDFQTRTSDKRAQ